MKYFPVTFSPGPNSNEAPDHTLLGPDPNGAAVSHYIHLGQTKL